MSNQYARLRLEITSPAGYLFQNLNNDVWGSQVALIWLVPWESSHFDIADWLFYSTLILFSSQNHGVGTEHCWVHSWCTYSHSTYRHFHIVNEVYITMILCQAIRLVKQNLKCCHAIWREKKNNARTKINNLQYRYKEGQLFRTLGLYFTKKILFTTLD